MKIAQVVATFPPYPGGTGIICYYYSKELMKRGHLVSVFTIDYGYLKNEYKNDPGELEIIRLKSPFKYGGGGFFPQLYKKILNYDIIHLHYPFFGGAEFIFLASALRGKKYFLTYHMDPCADDYIKKFFYKVYDFFFYKRILKKAAKITIYSKEFFYSSKISQVISFANILVLPNGVDPEIFSPQKKNKSFLQKYSSGKETILLHIGHLIPFKGLPLLLNALSKLKDRNFKLLVIGQGIKEKVYKNLACEYNIGKKVFFIGHISHFNILSRYYNICDFLVVSSIHTESFGLVILEAMASGKPVIVSSIPGPAALIDNYKDGLIFNINDSKDLREKIEYFIDNKKQRLQMGKAAREKVLKKYSWDKIGHKLNVEIMKIKS